MAELRHSQQQALNGGTHTTDALLGDFIAALEGIWMPPLDARDGGTHHDVSFTDMMESLTRRLGNVNDARVYKDSADGMLQFSVTPFNLVYRNMLCTFAGQTGIDLTSGQLNYIWVDLSAAPTLTIGVGTAWPASPPIPYLRLDAIDCPVATHWKEEHRVRHLRSQAITPLGGQVHVLRSHVLGTVGSSVSPVTIGTVPAECVVGRCQVLVRAPFNGSGMSLTIGNSSDADQLTLASEVDLSTAGTYSVDRLAYYGSQADILATFDLGGATTGIAHIFVEQR